MDNKMIRVAITHGDTNGVGYELIFRTFEAQEMLELCTPVIYGSPKVAAFHRNALQMQVSYTNIGNVTEAKDGRLNMLAAFPEEVKVELGTPTEQSDAAALKALVKAREDYAQKAFDALVTAPTVERDTTAPLPMLINEQLRMALATTARRSAATSVSRSRASPSWHSIRSPEMKKNNSSSQPSNNCRRRR